MSKKKIANKPRATETHTAIKKRAAQQPTGTPQIQYEIREIEIHIQPYAQYLDVRLVTGSTGRQWTTLKDGDAEFFGGVRLSYARLNRLGSGKHPIPMPKQNDGRGTFKLKPPS